jgi:hypothetical protein
MPSSCCCSSRASRRTARRSRTPARRAAAHQSVTNVGTDEVAASGTYSAGGAALTNTTPVQTNPITSAAWSYSNSVSFTGATLSVIGAYIYNTTVRMGHSTFALAANRVTGLVRLRRHGLGRGRHADADHADAGRHHRLLRIT